MWTYDRNRCELRHDGALIGQGYSGHGWGLNNPAAQNVRGIGPLPAGVYTIGEWADRPHLGAITAPLTPDPGNEMFDRSGFFLHGDNVRMDHSASDGCIILAHQLRVAIRDSGDVRLTVT